MTQEEIMTLASVKAADPCIQYFGKWTSEGERRYTKSRFSAAFSCFRGDSVELSALTGPDQGRTALYLYYFPFSFGGRNQKNGVPSKASSFLNSPSDVTKMPSKLMAVARPTASAREMVKAPLSRAAS
jgi:hypothetical protein